MVNNINIFVYKYSYCIFLFMLCINISYQKSGLKKSVGRILLKGDNITLVRNLDDLNM